ncbi:MAG: hypothetical protein IRZ18_02925 [Clostridia bacterium]|nr:hypothetical protein [Clostridia bacterium]
MDCPQCGGRRTGRIAAEQFFCWDCCVEFGWHGDELAVYSVDEEGELVPIHTGASVGTAGAEVSE